MSALLELELAGLRATEFLTQHRSLRFPAISMNVTVIDGTISSKVNVNYAP